MRSSIYRISVSVLEKFRRFQVADDSNTWDTEAALIDAITGKFEGNEKTRCGSAFHKLIERGRPERTIEFEGQTLHIAEGHAFTEAQAEVAYAYKREHPQMFCEVPTGKRYDTAIVSFFVSGRVDGLEGAYIRDAKTKYGEVKTQAYLDSFQSRFYMDMMEAKAFFYDVFEVKGFDNKPNELRMIGRAELGEQVPEGFSVRLLHEEVKFIAAQIIPCYPYTEMKRDLSDLINAFTEWVSSRNLWHLLQPCDEHGYKTARPTATPT